MNRIIHLLAVIFFSCITMSAFAAQPVVKQPKPVTLQQYIDKYCKADCIDAETLLNHVELAGLTHNLKDRFVKIMLAIIRVESRFVIHVENGSSKGLTQTNIRYHKSKFTDKNYFDPEQNIYAGVSIYAKCSSDHRGVLTKTLTCYNGGGNPDYVEIVLDALNNIERLTLR